jgi:hypothetical protein
LFSIDDQETERVKAELKWLTGELAPARDLDVYVRNESNRFAVSSWRGVE